MSLLRVENLQKRFGGVQALAGVGFTLERGEFTALIGPNGAGKSTLFSVIAGQYPADAGGVVLAGRYLPRGAERRAREGIGRTFQTAATFASMSLLENVQTALAARAGRWWRPWRALWARRGSERPEAERLLEQVGLAAGSANRINSAAADLPYADQKRLELAIALAGRPRLLLMDEPTAGMAPAERFALMDLVRDLAAEAGLTVLFTEHSVDVVFRYARRVMVLAQGRLIADGEPQSVRRDAAVQAAYFGEAAR